MRLSQAAYRHPGQANLDQTFSYNAIDQLNGTTTYQGSQGYRYDNNGNRTQQLSGSNTYAYAYPPGSNRLQSVAGPVPKAYQYDAAGNITSDGQGLSYSYDDLGRLRGMSQRKQTGDAITTKAMGYTYDGLGQRFMKGGNAAGVIFYAYDETGRLLSEQDVSNVASQDTIWLDDLPVGVVKQGQLHYIHADHLHTPRAILDPQNRPRWRWDNADPFGVGQPDENPSGLGRFMYNPRFPGQVYDAESGLHYNYYRDGYEPRTGRYTQGDPIGLAGGVNPYAYVGGSPLSYVDPLGLAKKTPSGISRLGKGRQCNVNEMRECRAQCGNRGVDVCFVQMWMAVIGADSEGKKRFGVKEKMTCSCNDEESSCPTDDESQYEKFLRQLTQGGTVPDSSDDFPFAADDKKPKNGSPIAPFPGFSPAPYLMLPP